MALQSKLFRGDPKLEAAAVSDPAHITVGAKGEHVRKIQQALTLLDGANIDLDGAYGPETAAAVLTYKKKRNIINRSYQTQADNIVGKMTMASLDSEMQKKGLEPVRIIPLSYWRPRPAPSHTVGALLNNTRPLALNFAIGSVDVVAALPTPPHINPGPRAVLELRRNSTGSFEVTNGKGGNITVIDGGVAKIQPSSGPAGVFFPIKKDSEHFKVTSGKLLGQTLVVASANGFSASLFVVVKPFGGPPVFHPGVHHDHKPCKKWDDILQRPNNVPEGPHDPMAAALDKICATFAKAVGTPIPHGPEVLVSAARAILFVKRPLGSTHLEWYLKGGGKDFVEDDNIKDWVTRDSGIRKRLKREIFPRGSKPRMQGQFFFGQGEYAKDDAGQDFRFAFGSIDKVDFEVDLSDHLVRVWFQDRYEWHPFYPKLYPSKSGDVARDDNCVHAALVEMQDQGASDYWMKGVAEIPLSLISTP
jgi:peptidoglycan hydrolase-like protein with peptidoglycan-binding domain